MGCVCDGEQDRQLVDIASSCGLTALLLGKQGTVAALARNVLALKVTVQETYTEEHNAVTGRERNTREEDSE
jgi:hypothetical protein